MYRVNNEIYHCLSLTVSFISYVSCLTDCVDLSRSLMTEGISTCSSVSWTVNMSLSPPGGTMSLSMPRTWWVNVSMPNNGALKFIWVVSVMICILQYTIQRLWQTYGINCNWNYRLEMSPSIFTCVNLSDIVLFFFFLESFVAQNTEWDLLCFIMLISWFNHGLWSK